MSGSFVAVACPLAVARDVGTAREAVVALAALSMAAAAVHATVCAAHFRGAVAFGVFFFIAATLQAAWAILMLCRPSRQLLTAAAGNAAVLALWVISRTVGLPIGPQPWHHETIGAADALASLAEAAITIGALGLSAHIDRTRAVPSARTIAESPRVRP